MSSISKYIKNEEKIDNTEILYEIYKNLHKDKRRFLYNLNSTRFNALIDHKKILTEEIIDRFKHGFIKETDFEFKKQILGMMLNDISFYYAYISHNQDVIKIIKEILEKIDKLEKTNCNDD